MAGELIKLGHTITSTWLLEGRPPKHLTEEEFHKCLAMTDIAQVFASDCIITDFIEDSTTGGRLIEWGTAVCPGNVILRISVGPRVRGLMRHLGHKHYDTWEQLLEDFKQRPL